MMRASSLRTRNYKATHSLYSCLKHILVLGVYVQYIGETYLSTTLNGRDLISVTIWKGSPRPSAGHFRPSSPSTRNNDRSLIRALATSPRPPIQSIRCAEHEILALFRGSVSKFAHPEILQHQFPSPNIFTWHHALASPSKHYLWLSWASKLLPPNAG